MTYHDDKPSSSSFPLIAIAVTIVAIVFALVMIHEPATHVRVWVPAAPSANNVIRHERCFASNECGPLAEG